MGFLAIVFVLAIAGYFVGPFLMTYGMLLQERAKSQGPAVERPSTGERPSFPTGN